MPICVGWTDFSHSKKIFLSDFFLIHKKCISKLHLVINEIHNNNIGVDNFLGIIENKTLKNKKDKR